MKFGMFWIRGMLMMAAGVLFAGSTYKDEITDWRTKHEAGLKNPNGWLSVAGLFWLHDGPNAVGSDPQSDVVLPGSAPRRAGVLTFHNDKVSFEPAGKGFPGKRGALRADAEGHPDVVEIAGVELTIIRRGEKTGVRLRDPNAATRRDFPGLKWFPVDERWRVKAKWTAYSEPKTIAITNILGMTDQEPSPGYAEFTMQGQKLRLEPVLEDNMLFFIFKDQTSGKSTYGAGRFLYADLAKNGEVILDFNKAENPPCAFTAFATCPLPPRQNALAAPVEAGELNFGHH
jgi:uncharacterized protein (DUF1684 family)